MLKSLEQETAVQSFYQTYYMMIVQHVLSVVTDTSHTAGSEKFCYVCLEKLVISVFFLMSAVLILKQYGKQVTGMHLVIKP